MAKKNPNLYPINHLSEHFIRGGAVKGGRKKKEDPDSITGPKVPGVSYFDPAEWYCFPFSPDSFERGKYRG